MIFVMVGTHLKPFNRMLEKLDELVRDGAIKDEVIAQFGNSDYKIKYYKGKPFFDESERGRLIAKADLIITHGGAGCILDSLIAGKPTVVVPRLKRFDEHTDDHQLEMAKAFEKDGKIVTVYDISELKDAIRKAKSRKFVKRSDILADRLKKYLSGIGKG